MRCLRKFVSLVTIAAIAVVPLLSVGCNEQPSASNPSASQKAPTTTETTTTTVKTDKGKKRRRKGPRRPWIVARRPAPA